MSKEDKNNLLHAYLPLGAIASCVICAFYVGAKIQTLDTLNSNVVAYMDTYSAVKFNNLERDIEDNTVAITSVKEDIKSIKLTLNEWQLSE